MERFGRLHGRRFTDGMMSTLHDMMSRPRDNMPNAPTADLPPEDVSAEPQSGLGNVQRARVEVKVSARAPVG